MRFKHLPAGTLAVTQNFEQLQTELTPEVWKGAEALGFEHSWKNLEAGRKAEYRKVFETVELRGLVSTGENEKSAFVLPLKYRPKEDKSFILDTHSVPGKVDVTAKGEVIPIDITAGASKVWTSLDQVRFSVE